eukprot:39935-Chlamydomonas_euryale.AAC.1
MRACSLRRAAVTALETGEQAATKGFCHAHGTSQRFRLGVRGSMKVWTKSWGGSDEAYGRRLANRGGLAAPVLRIVRCEAYCQYASHS